MADSSPTFEVRTEVTPDATLLAGFSEYGLAGLTAVDYLVERLELEQVGHVAVEGLPTITPFEEGTPRPHTRLFTRDGLDVTVLVGELAVPPMVAEGFAADVLGWTEENGVEEVVTLSGVPVAHAPDDHQPYYVASQDYQRARLDGTELMPMAGGFLAGLNGALMGRGMESPLRTCVFTTPVHPQTPDVEAALRLLDAVERVYDLGVDTEPLEEFAEEVGRYYAELAERLNERVDEGHDDRMYM